MNRPPAFQFYPKQWLGDDQILLMDWDARAMHMHLMCIAWQQEPPCTIPDDDAALRKWCGNPKRWQKLKDQILSAWKLSDGRWTQEGLVREWEKQRNYSESRRQAAEARWRKPVALAMHTDMHMHFKRNALQSSPKRKKERAGSLAKTSLPENLTISTNLWDWAAQKHWLRTFVEQEFEKFCNHNRATGNRYANWDAAFQNWLLKAQEIAAERKGRLSVNGSGSHNGSQHRERVPL